MAQVVFVVFLGPEKKSIFVLRRNHRPNEAIRSSAVQYRNTFHYNFDGRRWRLSIFFVLRWVQLLHGWTLDSEDNYFKGQEMTEAKISEIRGLMARSSFRFVLNGKVPPDTSVLPQRFSLPLKSSRDRKITNKARYVIGIHRVNIKHSVPLIHDLTEPICASSSGFFSHSRLWTLDCRHHKSIPPVN